MNIIKRIRIWFIDWRINDAQEAIDNARDMLAGGPMFIRHMEENKAALLCERAMLEA